MFESKSLKIHNVEYRKAVIEKISQHQQAGLKETLFIMEGTNGKCNEQERSVIDLWGIEELSMEEIAEVLK